LYTNLVKDYGLLGLEDPLDQEDWSGWNKLKTTLPSSIMVIGDDLIATNLKRLQKAIDNSSINAVIVKPNQIGTVTETVELMRLAQANSITTIASHRSGETNDYLSPTLPWVWVPTTNLERRSRRTSCQIQSSSRNRSYLAI
jgi:enolase